jgi:type VI secretion system protein ImpH
LIQALAEKPYAFDFFAAVRLLQCRFHDRPRIGYSASVKNDPLRFAQNPSLDFAPSTIEKFEAAGADRPPILHVRHFGLFGPNGPLPLCLTEYALDRMRNHKDPTFVEFCNVFHHRLLSFFFRAWADANKAVDLDRPEDERWIRYVGSLVGLGMESLQQRDEVPDRAKLYFTGRLVQQTRNAEGLQAILQDFFGLRTEVQSFVGRWLRLPADSLCQLGQDARSSTLGASVIVGSGVWTCQLHFRIRMGPMSLPDYERMLPVGASFQRLVAWVRNYSGEHYTWDLQLVLSREEVPETQLGRAGRLGWTTWLKTKPFDHHAEDLILQPQP